MNKYDKLVPKHIFDLVPYQSARRIGGHGHCFLNANEAAKSEFYFLNSTTLNRYPDGQPLEVLNSYIDYLQLPLTTNNIIATRGSDEAIALLVRTFCKVKEDAILIAPPCYGVYQIAANSYDVQVLKAKRNEDFTLNKEHIIEALNDKVKLVFIDSPANPLGILFSKEDLEYLLDKYKNTIFVMDEAYIEFAKEHSVCDLITKYDNLVVLRTLSKAFALAGIRLGFALGHKDIIDYLKKVIEPYPIPDPCAQIAKQALARGGIELMEKRVEHINLNKQKLKDQLLKLAITKRIHPSFGNYLLVEFTNGPMIFDALLSKGIVLRSFEDKPGLKNHIRITIGSDEELDELMRNLVDLKI